MRLSHNCFNSLPLTHLRFSLFWKHQFLSHLRFHLAENLLAEVSSLIASLKGSPHTNMSRRSQRGESSEFDQSWGKPAGIDLPYGFVYTIALVDLLTCMDVTSQLLTGSDENDDLTDEQDVTLTEFINTVYEYLGENVDHGGSEPRLIIRVAEGHRMDINNLADEKAKRMKTRRPRNVR